MDKSPGTKGNINKMWGRPIKHKQFTVKGWGFPKPALQWYRNRLNKIKNGKVVEIGVYGGASILSVIDICMKNNIKM